MYEKVEVRLGLVFWQSCGVCFVFCVFFSFYLLSCFLQWLSTFVSFFGAFWAGAGSHRLGTA